MGISELTNEKQRETNTNRSAHPYIAAELGEASHVAGKHAPSLHMLAVTY